MHPCRGGWPGRSGRAAGCSPPTSTPAGSTGPRASRSCSHDVATDPPPRREVRPGARTPLAGARPRPRHRARAGWPRRCAPAAGSSSRTPIRLFSPWCASRTRAPQSSWPTGSSRASGGCWPTAAPNSPSAAPSRAGLRDAGLVDVAADAFFPISGPACDELERASVERIRDQLVGSGLATTAEIDHHLAAVAARRARPRHLPDDQCLGTATTGANPQLSCVRKPWRYGSGPSAPLGIRPRASRVDAASR